MTTRDKDIEFFCLTAAKREVQTLRDAIRLHRDQKGDDRCWMDDEVLYKTLPEGYTPPTRDSSVELKHCEQFIACRHNPGTEYISPQRRIEELEQQLKEACEELQELRDRDRIATSNRLD